VWILGGSTGALHWDGKTVSPSWMSAYVGLDQMWAGPGLGVFAAGAWGILHHAD
jgi:hypothetical protein